MRIGFISDIHGNYTALEAVLADLKGQHVDRLICLGDTVSLGPQPKEALAALVEWDAVTIMGNHDQAILEPENAAKFQITEHLIPDLYWGREHLSKTELDYIRSFRPTHTLQFPNGIELLAYHGSPKSTTDILLAGTAPELFEHYFDGRGASVFIGGHSHIQMQVRYGKRLILNAGSVGNAFKYSFSPGNPPSLLPWAEYAVVEQEGNRLRADMRRVYFDIPTLLEHVKKSGLPGTDWWLRQYSNA